MSQAKTIYICDDDQWIRSTIEEIIIETGLKTFTFENGKLALEQIAKNPPDLILTDIHMPEMTGLDLLKFLSANSYKIPVIFLTGSLDIKNLQEAVAYGHFDYLNKPIQPFELIECIQKALTFGYQPSALSPAFKERLKKHS
jgi:CheY-like chemotaxis protein